MNVCHSLPCCWLLFNWILVLFGEQDKWWLTKSSLLFISVTQCIATHFILYASSNSCTEFGIVYSLGDGHGDWVCAACCLSIGYPLLLQGRFLLLKSGNWGSACFKTKILHVFSDFQYLSFTSKACVVAFDNSCHLWSSLEVQTMTCVNHFNVVVPRKGVGSL